MDKKNNTGHYNTGHCNSGHYNPGSFNAGDYNPGKWNTGKGNTGWHNAGNYNSGHYNTGCFNDSSCNSGFFNSSSPTVRAFNKDTDLGFFEYSRLIESCDINLKLVEEVGYGNMTQEERDKNPEIGERDIYLRKIPYKIAWANWWNQASEESKKMLMRLPNFDAAVFKEITGIDVSATCNGKIVEIDGKKYELREVKE